MSRVVPIVDSGTGALVDAAGFSRETGRYSRFARRMLSTDRNPNLDYGCNGGDSLTVSKNGNAGSAINLLADVVNVSGTLKSAGQTVQQIAQSQIAPVLGRISGAPGEISVTPYVDQQTGNQNVRIGLAQGIDSQIEQIAQIASSYVSGDVLAGVVSGLESGPDDDLAALKAKFNTLLSRLSDLASGSSGEG